MTNAATVYSNYQFNAQHPELLIPYLTNDSSSDKGITLSRIEGALTNVIYKAGLLDKEGRSTGENFLIRIYDTQNDSIVNRDDELNVLRRLPESFEMIKILFHFKNGRVEKFLDDYRAIRSDEMKLHYNLEKIAYRFKELHTLTELTVQEQQKYFANSNKINYNCFCWDKIFTWVDAIEKYTKWVNVSNSINIQVNFFCKDWNTLKSIIFRYKQWLTQNDSVSFQNMALCHNDTQHGNIMLERTADETSNIIFIDFEYGGVDTISFDLANFLTECMHDYETKESYICDPKKYPSQDQIKYFIEKYLKHLNKNEILQADIENLYNSVTKWRACSQLFWSVWAVLQSGTLNITTNDVIIDQTDRFEYLKFCQSKMSLFWNDMLKLGIANSDDCILDKIGTMDVDLI
ncbi:similar to Saccharomyces cerevisiae YDR147W EKI1 Ethanolamine kinase [Maudiozyma saulgeensis]|uniref:Similar to Saccharomyces cerevisiae YDR147W EKI1 Ethanolamine kinase n=1 Tax=Maudiozyma saulgeensis TaxID=1789683 RepID=A0A1X7R768_9SACH|nr:similar to Saccharomyces cerevisiae YDR147W EKI1 Ethanolamine kinase [Kazachstania saulgeensis]